jgi:hypothetical protein
MMVMTGSLTGMPDLSGTGMMVPPGLALQLDAWSRTPVLDFGPPALPVLMVRAARKAVEKNPRDPDSHLTLMAANEMLRTNQEDW